MMRRSMWRVSRIIALSVGVSIGTALPTACQGPRNANLTQTRAGAASAVPDQTQQQTESQEHPSQNDDQWFAQTRQARITQEVRLHAAMYTAAVESNVGRTGRFLLEPVQEDHPPDLRVDPDEFRQQVMQELAGLNAELAWAPPRWRSQQVDYFPGTQEKATRLQIRVIERIDDQATVRGEISDTTHDAQSSRQRVTCTWDGQQWQIERDRVRVVW